MIVPNCEGATIPAALPKSSWPRMQHVLRRAWGRVRWKMVAIITFTGTSTILIACLSVAALNVVVRRESSNIVEKQIQLLVQASRSVAPAILDHAGACTAPLTNSGPFKPLQAYTDEVFPQAQTSLTVKARSVQSSLPGQDPAGIKHPAWVPETGFTGLVVDRGQLEIRNVVVQQRGACNVTAIFSLPLGSEFAKSLSSAGAMGAKTVSPKPFLAHPKQRVLRTIEGNFLPGISERAAVVLTVRNWETGAPEDWVAFSVQPSYANTFEDV